MVPRCDLCGFESREKDWIQTLTGISNGPGKGSCNLCQLCARSHLAVQWLAGIPLGEEGFSARDRFMIANVLRAEIKGLVWQFNDGEARS